jgi:hypothetical protein
MSEWSSFVNLAFVALVAVSFYEMQKQINRSRLEMAHYKLEPLRRAYFDALDNACEAMPAIRRINMGHSQANIAISFARLTRNSNDDGGALRKLRTASREYLQGIYGTRAIDRDVKGTYPNFTEATRIFAVYAGVNYQMLLFSTPLNGHLDWQEIMQTAGSPMFVQTFTCS